MIDVPIFCIYLVFVYIELAHWWQVDRWNICLLSWRLEWHTFIVFN